MDTAGQSPVLDAVDHVTLTHPVRQALGSGAAKITDWRAEQISFAHFNPTSEGLYRFSGTAHERGVIQPWSLVLKVVHAPMEEGVMAAAGHLPSDWNYWKREFLAFQSGLLDELPGGVVAPRCYGASEREDGSIWLWLEEITDSYGLWQPAQYAVVAQQLGQLNGAYLAGRPFPTHPWLSRGFLRGWVASFGPAIEGLGGAFTHPLVQRGFPGITVGRLTRLWAEREQFFAGLDRLPTTLAHLDASRQNLFVRRTLDGRDQAVAIDWALMGREAIGVELAPFVAWSAMVTGDVANLRALDQTVFASYLSGLAASGWAADERVARLGYVASAALRMGALLGNYWSVCELEDPQAFAQDMFQCSAEEVMDRVAGALDYVLDLADEARELLPA